MDLETLGRKDFMVQHREGTGAKMGPFSVEVCGLSNCFSKPGWHTSA